MTRNEELADFVRELAAKSNSMPLKAATLVLVFQDDIKHRIGISLHTQPRQKKISKEAAENVLAHIPEHDQQGLKSSVIMRRTGLKARSHFLSIMRRLRLKGVIVRDDEGRYRKAK